MQDHERFEASTSQSTQLDGSSKDGRRARLVGELPPAVRGIPSISRQDENDVQDGDQESDADSEFDGPVKTEGGLAAKIAQLDERQFEDNRRIAERDGSGQQEAAADDEDSLDLLGDYEDDTEELELTHARLRSLNKLRLERFRHSVKRLSLRQNLLSSLVLDDGSMPIGELSELEELDLYDNRLPSVKGLKGLKKLKSLDLSFNLLRRVPKDQLSGMESLGMLYFIQNKISMIEGLDNIASSLTSIEFGGNKLRTIENLSSCVNLTELWLGKNKITKLDGMSTLRNLKILSIQSNRIMKIEGLEELTSLEEVYLSHNGIKKLEGLENNTKLRVLDIGNNYIKDIENIAHLSELEEFWANHNAISDFQQVEPQLSGLKNLETVYLEGNPIEASLGGNYRRKIMLALPQVGQIDATYVHRA